MAEPLKKSVTEKQTVAALLSAIRPMLDSIDLGTDLSETVQGALNSVAASGDGVRISDEAKKLAVLLDRGDITSVQYADIVKHWMSDG